MEPYAVIETGGKQYRVKANDAVQVEKLAAEVGDKITLSPVLAVSDGQTLRVGAPAIGDAGVTASVVDQIRGEKVVSFKKKRRKGYSRKVGHRQSLTVLRIEDVGAKAEPKAETEEA